MPAKSCHPTHRLEITEHIVHMGGFADGLAKVSEFMRSDSSSTVIVRGDPGCGKKTVIAEAEEMCKSRVICVHLNPYVHSDDYSTIRYLAKKLSPLGFKVRASIHEIVQEIEQKSIDKNISKKIVIVLEDFEEFCRQKQSLLYSLTHLTQHGKNIGLIGLTMSLDCTEHLEKRVRSRLNTLFYELQPPYRSKEEYVDFASILLGKYKIVGKLKEQLEYMYIVGNRSIRDLKRYLLSICDWDKNGKMTIGDIVTGTFDPQNDIPAMTKRLYSLTKPQLELLKIVVCCCDSLQSNEFTLSQIDSYTAKHEYHGFDTKSQFAINNLALLVSVGFVKARKPQQGINRSAPFTINIMPTQLKHILQNNDELHWLKSDPLWKKINT